MDTGSLVPIGILVVAIIILLYAYYYISRRSKNKSGTIPTPEPKPPSTVIESPKVTKPADTTPAMATQSIVVEAPKKDEPINLTPMVLPPSTINESNEKSQPVDQIQEVVPKSVMIETPKESEPAKPTPEVTQSPTVEAPMKTEPSQVEKFETKQRTRKPVPKGSHGYKVIDIEGIGPTYAAKLNNIGIQTTSNLLESGATPAGRKELSEKTEISPKLILKWVNISDLFRIKGIGEEYSDLLEEAGVDTVVELSHRNAVNLHVRILEINASKKLVRRPPSVSMVENWINEAKELPRKIEY